MEEVEAELRKNELSHEHKKHLKSLKREYEEEYKGVFLEFYLQQFDMFYLYFLLDTKNRVRHHV